jgi:cellulose synthase/poly-beta-1,6-N-acetylglucosamine synthase-like glycosyltransferase
MDNRPLLHSSVRETLADWETNDPASWLGVSVVIPSYNDVSFVGRSLRSVLNHSLSPLEWIVIDDGSRDDSIKAIEQELKDCVFYCKLNSRSNRRLAATLNEGLERNRDKSSAYLGSDDVWLPAQACRDFRVADRPRNKLERARKGPVSLKLGLRRRLSEERTKNLRQSG